MLDLTPMKINDNNDSGWLDLALSSNKDNVQDLTNIKDRLILAYNNYENIITEYTTKPINSTFLQERKLLKNFYEHAPTNLNRNLLEQRNEHLFEQCPFCGRPCKPSILDHFLPKDLWPEFCIFPNNLVSQCDKCSTKKWSHYYSDIDNSVKFIHPKFFNLLQFIGIQIEINFPSPESIKQPNFVINFTLPRGMNINDKKRLSLHIKYLNIKNHIREYITEKYLYWIRVSEQKKYYVPDSLNQRIKENYTGGNNNRWDVALYLAMINNDFIVNYFDSFEINTEIQDHTDTELEILSDD
ncbi:hypothetical protein C0W96_10130 [Photobacterium kishitanii]|uniref:HNH endonuclease n=1 Tax=Photobacterium kishitanii TaxID=318456 RepID=UPI000D1595E1|nr:HNH endonuclease [Photobacterium kishitanii]PSV06011.1 hypothetical protein C0W96_10130 [Photobacterium kishitanii]PSV74797.1 hypothetical protein C0W29_13785 [Photobacterium kishitanii]